MEPGEKKFTSDLINITADNITNKIRNKGVRISNVDSTNELACVGKVGDGAYEVRIDIRNINTSVKNNKIYELGVIIK